MLSVSGADHIITMDLHASQIQVGFTEDLVMQYTHIPVFYNSIALQTTFFL